MIKLLADIMGYEQLLILGLALLLGVIAAVVKWTLIVNFLRGEDNEIKKWFI